LIFYGNGERKFPEMADFVRLPALQKLSSRLEIAGNLIETHEHAGEFEEY
jgi:hypothetical protein